MSKINIGILGATGLVGEAFMTVLAQREFPVGNLRLFASQSSKGETRPFNGDNLPVDLIDEKSLSGLDLLFVAGDEQLSKEWTPKALKAGVNVIDNSSAFRLDPNVPLVIPEVNGTDLKKNSSSAVLITNPNCSTIQLVMVLNPLAFSYGLRGVRLATYQALSGAGRNPKWIHPISNNCVPQIGDFDEHLFAGEETKIRLETRKLMSLPNLSISAFCVRVPVENCHSQACWVTINAGDITVDDIRRTLQMAPGLRVLDNPSKSQYPLARDCAGKDDVFVGRIHQDLDNPMTFLIWSVSDNLRKGAATNAVQIAERLFDITYKA